LRLSEGKAICPVCGAVFLTERAHEDIEIYICYRENDTFGRRTKDSLVAQEVYRKLENAGFTGFYERISAGNLVGDRLTEARYGAMEKAKVVLVLGTSAESFQALSQRYGPWMKGKTVIPFCVDVGADAIPVDWRRIQAVNYTTIGWDQDLIKVLQKRFGREPEADTPPQKSRRKTTVLVAVIAAALLLAVVGLVMLLAGRDRQQTDEAVETEERKETEATEEGTDVYAQANALMNEGKLTQALALFQQIPEHPDSANKCKLIYSRFEGYYQAGEVKLHLDMTGNSTAKVSVTRETAAGKTAFSETMEVSGTTVSGSYRDNKNQTGTVDLRLEDTGIRLTCTDDGTGKCQESFFALAERSDQPLSRVDAQTLYGWLEKRITFSQLREQGYELEEIRTIDPYGLNRLYRIKDTEIYLSMYGRYVYDYPYGQYNSEDKILLGIGAPASLVAADRLGQDAQPYFEGDFVFLPNIMLSSSDGGTVKLDENYYASTGNTITNDTMVSVMTRKIYDGDW